MFKKIIYFLIFFLINANIFANQIDISSYEEDLTLKLKQVPKEKHFYLYAIAGRELADYRLYLLSQKYFYMALQEESHEDKTQIYIRLLQINYHRRAHKEAKETYKKLIEYWSGHKEFEKKGRIIYFEALTFLESWLFSDMPEKLAINHQTPFTKGSAADLTFKNTSYLKLFRDGHYKEALELLDRDKIINSNSVDLQSEYDLLVLLNQKDNINSHQLTCTKLWKKYQKSYSYGVLICEMLNDLKQSGKIDSKKEDALKDYFSNFDDEMDFLSKALQTLIK